MVLSVEDEGMPPHVIERATEPFFTTKGAEMGTGLGLAMVHGFVEQSRGRLEITSELGRGTIVRMLFPVALEPAAPLAAPPELPPSVEDARRPCETILLVEDSEDVRSLAEGELTELGYKVVAVASAEEALLALDRGPSIDLLFTDIVMPGGMNGIELAERVARRLPEVPALLTTGYNDDLVADARLSPALDVIGKPYRGVELAERVRVAIDRRHAGSRRRRSGFGIAEA